MENKNMWFEYRIGIEKRITKAEEHLSLLHDDIREIKKTQKWILRLIFSLNSTIIGILAKGFNII